MRISSLAHAYDVIKMCAPAAPPIRLRIRTRTQNRNPNPNPRTHTNPNPILTVTGKKRFWKENKNDTGIYRLTHSYICRLIP